MLEVGQTDSSLEDHQLTPQSSRVRRAEQCGSGTVQMFPSNRFWIFREIGCKITVLVYVCDGGVIEEDAGQELEEWGVNEVERGKYSDSRF